jgi:hypothetical protein
MAEVVAVLLATGTSTFGPGNKLVARILGTTRCFLEFSRCGMFPKGDCK